MSACKECGWRGFGYDPAGVPIRCDCQPSAYSDKPAPLTEERVREIVREEIARAQMTAEQAQDALKRAIDGLVARGIELRAKP